MKKLFTLLFAISCALIVNAQITESGNGFKETFDYPDSTIRDSVTYEEGLLVEWPENSRVLDGVLTWEWGAEGEGWFGIESEDTLDLTGNANMTFKYKFPQDSAFVDVLLMDTEFIEYEVSVPFVGGVDTLQEITLDLSTATGIEGGEAVDVSKLLVVGIIFYTELGGTFYLDDILLGDAELEEVIIIDPFTESGNGFLERFDYADGTMYGSVVYEGIGAEWGDDAVIENGMLKWDLADSTESAFILWELEMDISGNTDITFKYQFPAGAEFGIWIEDNSGGGDEIWPEDFILGASEMTDYTFDASAIPGIDLSDVAEIWIMGYTETAGIFYLDDIVIGDGWSLTGIPGNIAKSNLHVYPNPASEEFRIDSDFKSLSVYNSIGQIVNSVENYQKGSSVDISDLGKGLYIIKADVYNYKLIVE